MKHEWPYTVLYDQTADFTYDLALLPHDDFIDTISMSKYVVKTKGRKYHAARSQPSLTERILRNKPIVKGLPLLSGVSSAEITDTDMNILSQQRRGKLQNYTNRRRERPKSPRRKRT
jgi:hypothetical protein